MLTNCEQYLTAYDFVIWPSQSSIVNQNWKSEVVWFLVKCGLLFSHLEIPLLIGIENQMWFGFYQNVVWYLVISKFHFWLELKIRCGLVFSKMWFVIWSSKSSIVNWNWKSDVVWFLVKCSLLFGNLKVPLLIGIENQMWFGF